MEVVKGEQHYRLEIRKSISNRNPYDVYCYRRAEQRGEDEGNYVRWLLVSDFPDCAEKDDKTALQTALSFLSERQW